MPIFHFRGTFIDIFRRIIRFLTDSVLKLTLSWNNLETETCLIFWKLVIFIAALRAIFNLANKLFWENEG